MLNQMTVAQFMTRPVVTVTPDTPIGEAHRIMKDKAIRRLLVVEHGKLAGIISIGDIREAEPSDATSLSIWEINYLWSKLTVGRVMSREVVTLAEEDTIIDAARLILQHKIGGLPVVDDDGKPVGILTESDIFRMLIQLHLEEESRQVTP
jgi:CBS domain-containing protein